MNELEIWDKILEIEYEDFEGVGDVDTIEKYELYVRVRTNSEILYSLAKRSGRCTILNLRRTWFWKIAPSNIRGKVMKWKTCPMPLDCERCLLSTILDLLVENDIEAFIVSKNIDGVVRFIDPTETITYEVARF